LRIVSSHSVLEETPENSSRRRTADMLYTQDARYCLPAVMVTDQRKQSVKAGCDLRASAP
jgi:hypothetical protein